MAQISFDINESIQQGFAKDLTAVARKAFYEESKKQGSIYGKEWLKQKEACEWLNISYNTLQLWRTKGLKISTIEGITLISKKEINRFLEENEV